MSPEVEGDGTAGGGGGSPSLGWDKGGMGGVALGAVVAGTGEPGRTLP